MLRTAEQAAQIFEAEHPQVTDCLGALGLAGVRYAIVGSRTARLASLMLGTPDLAEPDDWDLQILPEDFELAVDRTRAEVRRDARFEIPTGDGQLMCFAADDARAHIGSDTIQFMRLHGLVSVNGRTFNTSFSSEAFAASQQHRTLHFAHDTETITLYGLRQGDHRMGKQDLLRAAATRAVRHPSTESYARRRALQAGWDDRLREFDAAAACKATEFWANAIAA